MKLLSALFIFFVSCTNSIKPEIENSINLLNSKLSQNDSTVNGILVTESFYKYTDFTSEILENENFESLKFEYVEVNDTTYSYVTGIKQNNYIIIKFINKSAAWYYVVN